MKEMKKILAVSFWLVVSYNLRAQDVIAPEDLKSEKIINGYELVAGASYLHNYGNSYLNNYEVFKPGYCFGFGVYHTFSSKLELNAKLFWETNGVKTYQRQIYSQNRIAYDQTIETETTNKYFTGAIQMNYKIWKRKNYRLNFGAYYSKLLDSGSILKGSLNGIPFPNSYSNSISSYENFDFGTCAGIGYVIPLRRNRSISLQLIDKLGLVNIQKPIGGVLPEKNNAIIFLISLMLKK
jgi:hypothetical protein